MKLPLLKKHLPIRSYSGQKFITNTTNKKYLAIDFSHRCAYCDDPDSLSGGYRNYQVEHFAPESKFKHLKYVYENLLYACPYCNRAKWDYWPSNDANISVVGEEGVVDPCTNEYYDHLDRNEKGAIVCKTNLGRYMHKTLKLYLKRHEVIYNLATLDEKRKELDEQIQSEDAGGIDTTKKKKVLEELHKTFFGYYDQWQQMQKTNTEI